MRFRVIIVSFLLIFFIIPLVQSRVNNEYIDCVSQQIVSDCEEINVWTECKPEGQGFICDKKIEAPDIENIKIFLQNLECAPFLQL